MGEADALARPVLRARAPEQFEDAGMIARRDSAAVIGDREADAAGAGRPGRDGDAARPRRIEILDGIVEQIAEHLLDREPVGTIDGRSGAIVTMAPAASA